MGIPRRAEWQVDCRPTPLAAIIVVRSSVPGAVKRPRHCRHPIHVKHRVLGIDHRNTHGHAARCCATNRGNDAASMRGSPAYCCNIATAMFDAGSGSSAMAQTAKRQRSFRCNRTGQCGTDPGFSRHRAAAVAPFEAAHFQLRPRLDCDHRSALADSIANSSSNR